MSKTASNMKNWERILAMTAVVITVWIAGWQSVAPGAETRIRINVKTVLASQGPEYSDPRLSPLIGDLRSVFRYTSYRMLSEDSIDLGLKETGSISLEGGRFLKITPNRIVGNRVELQLTILKGRNQIFQTVIRLLNNSGLIVGGPRHGNGHLLFKISGSF